MARPDDGRGVARRQLQPVLDRPVQKRGTVRAGPALEMSRPTCGSEVCSSRRGAASCAARSPTMTLDSMPWSRTSAPASSSSSTRRRVTSTGPRPCAASPGALEPDALGRPGDHDPGPIALAKARPVRLPAYHSHRTPSLQIDVAGNSLIAFAMLAVRSGTAARRWHGFAAAPDSAAPDGTRRLVTALRAETSRRASPPCRPIRSVRPRAGPDRVGPLPTSTGQRASAASSRIVGRSGSGSTDKARLEHLDGGLAPVTDGWFVLGVGDAA